MKVVLVVAPGLEEELVEQLLALDLGGEIKVECPEMPDITENTEAECVAALGLASRSDVALLVAGSRGAEVVKAAGVPKDCAVLLCCANERAAVIEAASAAGGGGVTLYHGRNDHIYPIQMVRDEAAAFSHVRLLETGDGHEVESLLNNAERLAQVVRSSMEFRKKDDPIDEEALKRVRRKIDMKKQLDEQAKMWQRRFAADNASDGDEQDW